MNTDEATGGIAATASGKLSGKRTEADIYATFMSVSVFFAILGTSSLPALRKLYQGYTLA